MTLSVATVRNKTKAELISELEELRASERKYRVMLDESSDPIFMFSPDGQYRYVNQAFASGVGKSTDEIIGKRIWDIFPQAEADKRFAVIRWVFENAESKIIEVRVPRTDGDRYYLTTAKPILDDHGQTTSVICISKEITERKVMEDRMAHMAQYDVLTDLPNRTLFSDRLRHAIAQAKRDKTHVALIFLDLDKFKPVNDTLGHHVGDLLLQAVATRMQECMRESDTVGRLGGDEFVVLLPAIQDAQDAVVVAEKIRHALNQPFELPGYQPQSISSSSGIAIYPEHGIDDIQLTKHADDAMYQAKELGRNRVQVFQVRE